MSTAGIPPWSADLVIPAGMRQPVRLSASSAESASLQIEYEVGGMNWRMNEFYRLPSTGR